MNVYRIRKSYVTELQIRVCIGKLFSLFLIQNICCGYSKEPSQFKKKSLSGPMMLSYVSYVYHMISGMIKVVVSAFEIYQPKVLTGHLHFINFLQNVK